MTQTDPAASARAGMPFREFVALMALMISITALSIDIMLPALPAIGDAFAVADANRRQAVVIAYMIGFSVGQLVVGPLADRFGRRPPLLAGLALAAAASVFCAFAPSFDALLAGRAVQGFGCAAPRVVSIAVVRDCFVGRGMARVMSLVMSVFIIVPMIAPAIGAAIVAVSGWRWVFLTILAVAVLLIVWAGSRLRETWSEEARRPLVPVAVAMRFVQVMANRQTMGYALATGLILGGLLGYVASAQQVFVDVYALGSLFPLAFAVVALAMAVAAYTNSRLVERLGMRLVSHAALCAYVVITGVFAFHAWLEAPMLVAFTGAMAASTFLFGLMLPNFNAMAMEPQGAIAGTASSFLGFFTTLCGALLGGMIGQAFDGSVLPLSAGIAMLGWLALATVWLAEGGRLFHARHAGA